MLVFLVSLKGNFHSSEDYSTSDSGKLDMFILSQIHISSVLNFRTSINPAIVNRKIIQRLSAR